MPRNGTGTFSLVTNSWNPAVNGVTATSADYQQLVNDIASAITQSLSADGQTPMTGNLQMGNNRISGLANAVGVADGVTLGQFPSLLSQWTPLAATATFISATSFRVPGDLTSTLQVGRRLKTINTGGTVYSTISTSVYASPNTTVTVQNDSGALDAGLSQVSYGVVSALDSSLPIGRMTGPRVFSASATYTATPGTKAVLFELYGSGGGGGGAPATGAGAQAAGGGGGAGGYGRLYLSAGFSGIPLVIGNPGLGVFGADGTAAGASSIAALSVAGGAGGKVGITRAAANFSGPPGGGGTVTGADLGSPGQAGGIGVVFAGGGVSGFGGNGPFGAGGVGVAADVTIAASGNNGLGYGSGGGGAVAVNSGSAPKGGDGAKGVCYVWEYA